MFTKAVYGIRVGKGASLVCNKCGVALVIGDACASQKSGAEGRRHMKIYHKKCYESTLIGDDSDV